MQSNRRCSSTAPRQQGVKTVSELLRVSNLDVRFDTARGLLHAVKDVSFNLEPGESLGIVGESGSGKTVLSRATMGLLTMSTAKKSG